MSDISSDSIALDGANLIPMPDDYVAAVNVGFQMYAQAKFDDALTWVERVSEQWPERSEHSTIVAAIAFRMGEIARAIKSLELAHEKAPEIRDYAEFLAALHTRIGNLNEGLYYAKLALTMEPSADFETLVPPDIGRFDLALQSVSKPTAKLDAMRCFEMRDYEGAVSAARKGLELDSDIELRVLMARSLLKLRRGDEALTMARSALQGNQSTPELATIIAESLLACGLHYEAWGVICAAMEKGQQGDEVVAMGLRVLSALPQEIQENRRCGFLKAFAQPVVIKSEEQRPKTTFKFGEKRKVRLGYLADRLFNCPEVLSILPILKNHNRGQFEVFCYQCFHVSDPVSTQAKAFVDEWRDLSDIDPVTVGYIIEGDRLDLLVDLTAPTNADALAILQQNPAPIVASLCLDGGKTGFPGLNAIVSDNELEDLDIALAVDGQQVAVCEGSITCFDPEQVFIPMFESPVLVNGRVTFGGVCDLELLTPETAALWSEVLLRHPSSLLLLGYFDGASRAIRERAISMFFNHGVGNRIVFQERTVTHGADALTPGIEFFSGVDVLLDTYPQSNLLAVSQAVLAGVPVASLKGMQRSGRLSASALAGAGHHDWVVDNHEAFWALVDDFVADNEFLTKGREERQKFAVSSRLFRPESVARDLENLYRSMLV